MDKADDKKLAKIKRLQNLYNMVPNLLWTALSLTPIFIFCYLYFTPRLVVIFSSISMVPAFIPTSFLDKIQLSRSALVYKKLGVLTINKVAQNGAYINRLLKKKFPDYKSVSFSKASAKKLLRQTYIYEKFHLVLFVFFTLTTVYTLACQYFGWAALFLVTNLFYNVYPNLLQQYIRVKLKFLINTNQKDS